MLSIEDFNYHLPKNLIAQRPVRPRDHSRLLVMRRLGGKPLRVASDRNKPNHGGSIILKHKYFYNLSDYLRSGDVLVLNNSKVFSARLLGKKSETGGKMEVFLLRKIRGRRWQCLLGGSGRRENLKVGFGYLECVIEKNNQDGTWTAKFNLPERKMMEVVGKIGHTPLPPYIKRSIGQRVVNDAMYYQTVYADNKKIGSVAAPTAGFHFTPQLIKKLRAVGVRFEYITLHVGLGTFAPVKVDDIGKHKMHAEYVEIKKSVMERIVGAKSDGRRIIAVGTTSVRALEAAAKKFSIFSFQRKKQFVDFKQFVDIFIYPPFKFRVVDAMITNFHLPKSTLLMLVSAFAGRDNIIYAYRRAVKNKYRFYSYGDAMLII